MSALNYSFVWPLANLVYRPMFSEQANLLATGRKLQEAELASNPIKLCQIALTVY
jgi:hypothetical protein